MQKTGKTFLIRAIVGAMLVVCIFSTTWAQQQQRPILDPLRNFGNSLRNIGGGNSVEADPRKEYKLTETEGPFLIMAVALSGPTAQQDARELVQEFRSKYKWNAYVFEMDFSRNANQDFGQARGIQYRNPPKTQYAVVIGSFPSLEDNQFKKTLEEVRACQPESLKGKSSVGAFSLRMAYGLANPLLPPEHRGAVDAFVESLNKDSPFSLLNNPRRYTVQIATFQGRAVVDPQGVRAIEERRTAFDREESALAIMGREAAELCRILRAHGWEAYEFHDRHSSIVTVGSFDQPTVQLPNGTTVPDPRIQQIMQQYKGRVINDVRCSSEPMLIEVPRVARR